MVTYKIKCPSCRKQQKYTPQDRRLWHKRISCKHCGRWYTIKGEFSDNIKDKI